MKRILNIYHEVYARNTSLYQDICQFDLHHSFLKIFASPGSICQSVFLLSVNHLHVESAVANQCLQSEIQRYSFNFYILGSMEVIHVETVIDNQCLQSRDVHSTFKEVIDSITPSRLQENPPLKMISILLQELFSRKLSWPCLRVSISAKNSDMQSVTVNKKVCSLHK